LTKIIPKGNEVQPPRRFLPSISLLSAFEAAARTGSVTAAARELDLTQSAVSRQIRALEAQLEIDLFTRERQTIRLTPAGEAYSREVQGVLHKLSDASLSLRANPDGGALNLAALPTFAARWLTPRLPGFVEAHPSITINVLTRALPFDFRNEGFDAAIHYGDPVWPAGGNLAPLMGETVLPVCSPGLRAQHCFADPAAVREARLLHLASRPDAWEHWLAQQGAPDRGVRGMLFDQFATLAAAAVAGLGVGLLPTLLIEQELASGTLVPALDRPIVSEGAYYLVCAPDRDDYPPLQAFYRWIAAEANAPPLPVGRGRGPAA
jgi:LysR family glycine cleavage system transcriptional activator